MYVYKKSSAIITSFLCLYLSSGNIFSTLGGHIFEWTLLPDEEATHQQASPEAILNFIPFEESSYSTDPVIRSLEREVCVCVRGWSGVCDCVRGWSGVCDCVRGWSSVCDCVRGWSSVCDCVRGSSGVCVWVGWLCQSKQFYNFS